MVAERLGEHQVAGAVRQRGGALLGFAEERVDPVELVAHGDHAGDDVLVGEHVAGEQAHMGLVADVGVRRGLDGPLPERFAAGVGEPVDAALACLSGLDGRGDPAEPLEAFRLGVDLARRGRPERWAAATDVVDEVVRARAMLADEGEDRVAEADRPWG